MRLRELENIIPAYHTVVIKEIDSQWPEITQMEDAIIKYGWRKVVRLYYIKKLTIEIQ